MLDAKSRWVVFQIFNFTPNSDQGNFPFKMKAILENMRERINSEDGLVKVYKNNTIALRIRDIQFNKERETATILFVYVDKNVSDPAFGQLEKNEIRTEPKLEGEGIALSFHYVIALKKIRNLGYIAVKEQVPGLQSHYILSFLRNYFKMFGVTTCSEDDQIESWPKLKIEILASQKITDDVNTRGAISGIELIKRYSIEQLDERAVMKEHVHRLKISLEKVQGEESLSIVERLINRFSKEFPEAKVTIKRNEGKSYTLKTSSDIHSVKDLIYGKTEKIGVNVALPQCSEAIRTDLTSRMIRLLLAEKYVQKKIRSDN